MRLSRQSTCVAKSLTAFLINVSSLRPGLCRLDDEGSLHVPIRKPFSVWHWKAQRIWRSYSYVARVLHALLKEPEDSGGEAIIDKGKRQEHN